MIFCSNFIPQIIHSHFEVAGLEAEVGCTSGFDINIVDIVVIFATKVLLS
jgi:hypothetical protein